MAKDIQVGLRIDEETKSRLDKLCEVDYRSQSDVVRWLINSEWDRRFHSPSPVTIEEAEAVAQ